MCRSNSVGHPSPADLALSNLFMRHHTKRSLLQARIPGVSCILMLICGCGTIHPELPVDVPINKDAGRGGWLLVNLRVDSAKEFAFILDTGTPITVLDRTLEPGLGKRLGTGTFFFLGTKQEAGVYAAPKFYLGRTLLATDTNIVTFDLSQLSSTSGRSIMGILGMDCLRHYCIQLDFQARKLRFLVPYRENKARWGQAFAVSFSTKGQSESFLIRPILRTESLAGEESTDMIIDTGGAGDWMVESSIFKQGALKGRFRIEKAGTEAEYGVIQECNWNGRNYRHVVVGKGENAIGLQFLARHLVTLDLPNRTMYLKQQTTAPLAHKELAAAAKAAGTSALKELRRLARLGRLPGKKINEQFDNKQLLYTFRSPDSVILSLRKKGDLTVYRYEFTRRTGSWKLEKAWRSDQNERTIEEYTIP
jgi:hypothetical protein